MGNRVVVDQMGEGKGQAGPWVERQLSLLANTLHRLMHNKPICILVYCDCYPKFMSYSKCVE